MASNLPPRAFEIVAIEEEMKRSYLDYAMSVIVSRALPDVRDGLKPSQRRILVAPTSGSWLNPLPDGASVMLRVVLRGADIRDVAQDANHTPGMGRNTLAEDVEVKDITIVAKPADMAMGSMPHRSATAVMSSDVLACIS